LWHGFMVLALTLQVNPTPNAKSGSFIFHTR